MMKQSIFNNLRPMSLAMFTKGKILNFDGKEMIRLKQLTPNLMVEDVNETVDFYKNILGFELVISVPQEGIFNWAMVKNGEVSLMFQEKDNIIAEYPVLMGKPLGGGLTLYIKVTDVQSLYNKIKMQAHIILDLHKTFYGAEEFAIQDSNGFVLTFAGDVIIEE